MGHEFAGEVGTIFKYEREPTVPDGRLGLHRNLGRCRGAVGAGGLNDGRESDGE